MALCTYRYWRLKESTYICVKWVGNLVVEQPEAYSNLGLLVQERALRESGVYASLQDRTPLSRSSCQPLPAPITGQVWTQYTSGQQLRILTRRVATSLLYSSYHPQEPWLFGQVCTNHAPTGRKTYNSSLLGVTKIKRQPKKVKTLLGTLRPFHTNSYRYINMKLREIQIIITICYLNILYKKRYPARL